MRLLALWVMCAAYVEGGVYRIYDFNGTVGEMARLGLDPAMPIAVAVIACQLGGSALVLIGRLRWLGALWLAGFTIIAALISDRFWDLGGSERMAALQTFLEHLGLAGAFFLVAWQDAFGTSVASYPDDEAFLEAASARSQARRDGVELN